METAPLPIHAMLYVFSFNIDRFIIGHTTLSAKELAAQAFMFFLLDLRPLPQQ
jgi:hypothetical protein